MNICNQKESKKNMKEKILLFIKTPPPFTGATMMNKSVYDSRILNNRFDVRAITISYSKTVNDIGKKSINKIKIVFTTILKLIRELTLFKPKLVYFQISPIGFAFIRDTIFVFIIKIFKIKIVYHLHGKGIKQSINNRVIKKIYKYVFNGEEVICLSQLLKYDIKEIYNGNIYIVNNGITDIKKRNFIKTKTNNYIVKIIFLSNLIITKGVLDYLDSLEILKNKRLNFIGQIIGAEAELSKNKLLSEIDKRKLKNIVFYLGPKYNDEKEKILEEASIFVFPTKMKWECFPLVLLEAMKFELPVISTKQAAIPDIIDDGKTGFLVDHSSPNQIANKLELLINNYELRRSMGIAGRKKFVENYTLDKFENNIVNVFSKILYDKKI